MADDPTTIAEHLSAAARARADGLALVTGRCSLTLGQLDDDSERCARGLLAAGLSKGERAVLMVRPGPDFLVVTFALFKMGAVPVLVDPGMGWPSLRKCLDEARPAAFIGVAAAQLARVALRWASRSVRMSVTVGSPLPIGRGVTLNRIRRLGADSADWQPEPAGFDEAAAIAFTSGSTGLPKGVVYTHRMFARQVQLLRDEFAIEPGEVDLATFPLFALFDPALGATTVFPEMDFTRPGRVDPRQILGPIRDYGVTHMFGSPALLKRLGEYASPRGLRLEGVRRVLSAGAPVSRRVVQTLKTILEPGADIHTPYGATEALPVSSISGGEILAETASGTGSGVCVGKPLDGIELRIMTVTDGPVERWSGELEVGEGEVGEIVVGGDNVSQRYFERSEANRLAKIRSGGRCLHRMGDLGYVDGSGRLWFCGRKAHRVTTPQQVLFSVCCEGVFNQHPAVFRTALVGIGPPGRRQPVICVELEDGHRPGDGLRKEILALGAADAQTAGIDRLLFHQGFPVDIRHNAKIFRERLAEWAEGELS